MYHPIFSINYIKLLSNILNLFSCIVPIPCLQQCLASNCNQVWRVYRFAALSTHLSNLECNFWPLWIMTGAYRGKISSKNCLFFLGCLSLTEVGLGYFFARCENSYEVTCDDAVALYLFTIKVMHYWIPPFDFQVNFPCDSRSFFML